MKIWFKVLLVFFVVGICTTMHHYLWLGYHPTMTTQMALDQMKNSNLPAETMRVVDTSKNWFDTSWMPLLGGITAIVCLFGGEFKKFLEWAKGQQ